MGDRCGDAKAAWCLFALSWLWGCSASHGRPEEAGTPDADIANEECGADAPCSDGLVCSAGRCVAPDAGSAVEAFDAGSAAVLDAGQQDPLVERVVVWQEPLDRVPSGPANDSVDLVVGDDGDLWLLGQLAEGFTPHLWLERMAPDGTLRWPEPWTSELDVALFGINRPEPIPAGFLVVDDLGRATVAATHNGSGLQRGVWLSQVDADGNTRWTVEQEGYYLSDLDVDGAGRVHAALGGDAEDATAEPRVTVARWLPDATRDALLPIDSNLQPPLALVLSALQDVDAPALYLAGARVHPFGGYEAFIGRYQLEQGTDTWPPGPVPRGPEDYSSVVDAASDGEGGIVAAVSTAFPMPNIASSLDSTEGLREVRRYDADGTLLWSTAMRDETGADRTAGLAEWGMRLAVASDGSTYATYTVVGDTASGGSPWGPADVVLDKLRPDGGFAWRAPLVVHDEAGLRPTGLAVGPAGELYMLGGPRLVDGGPWSWVTRLDPLVVER